MSFPITIACQLLSSTYLPYPRIVHLHMHQDIRLRTVAQEELALQVELDTQSPAGNELDLFAEKERKPGRR